MNSVTTTVWNVIVGDESLLAELTAIMGKQYPPFLSREQAVQVNAHQLEQHMVEEMTRWHEWLPDTAINYIGGELAMAILDAVEWSCIAELLVARL